MQHPQLQGVPRHIDAAVVAQRVCDEELWHHTPSLGAGCCCGMHCQQGGVVTVPVAICDAGQAYHAVWCGAAPLHCCCCQQCPTHFVQLWGACF